jgi:hypothetical protein
LPSEIIRGLTVTVYCPGMERAYQSAYAEVELLEQWELL